MQENNFEKQVQEKMDGLKLAPSKEVWQKVAVSIAKTKNDRRVFALLLFILFVLSSGIFILWNRTPGNTINKGISQNNIPADTTANSHPAHHKAGITRQSQDDLESLSHNDPNKERSTTGKPVDNTGTQPQTSSLPVRVKPATPDAINTATSTKTNLRKPAVETNASHNNKPKWYLSTQRAIVLTQGNHPESEPGEKLTTLHDRITMTASIHALTPATPTAPVVSINGHANDSLERILQAAENKELALKNRERFQQKGPWQIGFNVSFGITATQKGYLGIIGSGDNNALKLFESNPGQSTGGNGSPAPSPHVPSQIRTGAGIVLGLFVQKALSYKMNFQAGLNYKSYRSAITIGNRVDSVFYNNAVADFSSFYYRNGNKTHYNNQFHFIEIPVNIRFRLTKENRLPVYLNTGLSISRLIGSNALQFDTISDAYFRDNRYFNKTQLNVSAGFLLALRARSKKPFLIGPDINYSLGKMSNSGFYNNRHYSYFGLVLQKNIGKK